MTNLFDEAFMKAMNELSAKMFLEEQTEEGVRKRIDRGSFKHAVDLMKDWFRRKPEDVETLRRLKAYLIEKRTERRAVTAGYARTYRKNKRTKREAADTRVCVVCGATMKHKRAGAETCSAKCRVKKCRSIAL